MGALRSFSTLRLHALSIGPRYTQTRLLSHLNTTHTTQVSDEGRGCACQTQPNTQHTTHNTQHTPCLRFCLFCGHSGLQFVDRSKGKHFDAGTATNSPGAERSTLYRRRLLRRPLRRRRTCDPARLHTAQDVTERVQLSTAQHSTAQHSTAHNTTHTATHTCDRPS